MKETPTPGLAAALRALRLGADMTLEQVAESAGCSPSYLSRAENGQVVPSAHWVHDVATAIGKHIVAKAAA